MIEHYRILFQIIFEKNMLNSCPGLYNSNLTLQQFQEMVYRSSFFFQGEQLCQLILNVFFSGNTIGHSESQIALTACLNIKRICEKNIGHVAS
jgi:hypothetical protein